MYIERSEDLSFYRWLVDLFADAPFIKIVDGFPEELLELPTISIESVEITVSESELGNRTPIKERTYAINIFGKDKAQRDEYAYRIFNALENSIDIYDYSNYSSPIKVDCYDILDKRLQNMKVLPNLSEKLYYRAYIVLYARKCTL